MKIPTITNETQMTRSNDFCHATVGEIANFGSQCDRATVDDKCGCKRAMIGIDSKKASTTVKITDVDMTPEQLVTKLTDGYVNDWMFDQRTANHMARNDVQQLLSIGESFPLNAVLEIRGSKIAMRGLGA